MSDTKQAAPKVPDLPAGPPRACVSHEWKRPGLFLADGELRSVYGVEVEMCVAPGCGLIRVRPE